MLIESLGIEHANLNQSLVLFSKEKYFIGTEKCAYNLVTTNSLVQIIFSTSNMDANQVFWNFSVHIWSFSRSGE